MIKTLLYSFILIIFTGCSSITTVNRMIDGEMRSFLYQHGSPLPRENSWAKIEFLGPLFVGNKKTSQIHFMWGLTFIPKISKIKSVTVYDVTTQNTELIISENDPKISASGNCNLESSAIEFTEKNVPWFFDTNDTERIFKIVIKNRADIESIIYQSCVINAETKSISFSNLIEIIEKT